MCMQEKGPSTVQYNAQITGADADLLETFSLASMAHKLYALIFSCDLDLRVDVFFHHFSPLILKIVAVYYRDKQ